MTHIGIIGAGAWGTALTLAVADPALGRKRQEALSSERFRPYLCQDVVGAQLGGALKNVLAIACGIAAGQGFRENTRSALITRGLAKRVALGEPLGADRRTLMGFR